MSARIAIDARKLADFGIGAYLRGLIGALATFDDGHRYFLLAPAAAAALLPNLPDRFEWVEEPTPQYSRAELFAISRQARRLGADLLHCPHYVVPFAPPCPVVVTIHDAIHLTHPQTLPRPRALAYGYAKLMLGRAVRIAERVIAVSHAAAAELESELRIAPGKLAVVPNGVDPIFAARPPAGTASSLVDTTTRAFPTALVAAPPRKEETPMEGVEGEAAPRDRTDAAAAEVEREPPAPTAEATGVFRRAGDQNPAAPAARAGSPPAPRAASSAPSVPPTPLRWSFPAPEPTALRTGQGGRPTASAGPLLFVGNPKPHKNLRRLVEAYARLVRARGAGAVPPLVLAGGGREPVEEGGLRALARRLGVAGSVHALGFVSPAELVELYRSASMLVFPTLAEGFGLPIAEAMACGTPVVVSDLPVHREIAGDAGELVDPLDPASIAAGVARLLDDPDRAARRAAAGRRLAARFSWAAAAAATSKLYDEAMPGTRRRRARGAA